MSLSRTYQFTSALSTQRNRLSELNPKEIQNLCGPLAYLLANNFNLEVTQ